MAIPTCRGSSKCRGGRTEDEAGTPFPTACSPDERKRNPASPFENAKPLPGFASLNPGYGLRFSALLPRLFEIVQIRRRLILAGWHQEPIGAQVIGFIADLRPRVAFLADEFVPIGPRVGIANIAAGHSPRARQGVIVDGDLVAYDVPVVLVEIDALLEDRLVVMMQWYAGRVIMAGALSSPRLHPPALPPVVG